MVVLVLALTVLDLAPCTSSPLLFGYFESTREPAPFLIQKFWYSLQQRIIYLILLERSNPRRLLLWIQRANAKASERKSETCLVCSTK